MVIKKTRVSPQYFRRDKVCVSILEIKSPSHYVVKESPTVNTSSDAKKFVEAEEMMQRYYQSVEQGFFQLPLKDSVVVVQQNNKYYRASVRSIFPISEGHLIKVYLLDYGQECNVMRKFLFEIHKDFLAHPFQAVELKLLNIEPISLVENSLDLSLGYGPVSTWDASAMTFIENKYKVLNSAHMTVKGVGDNFIYGALYMTLDNQEVVCINEELIHQKFAQSKKDFWNDVIPIDSILPKPETLTRRHPGVACEDFEAVNLSSHQYTTTPTLSQKPECLSVENSPSFSAETPNSQSESVSMIEKLKMLKRKSSLGLPNIAAVSQVNLPIHSSSVIDPPRNGTLSVGDENKLKSQENKSETVTPIKTESESHSVENSPSPAATNTPNSQSEPSNRLDKLKMLRRKSSLGVPNSTAGSPVTADCGASSNRSTDSPPANATSKVIDENKLKSTKNEAETSNKTESESHSVENCPLSAATNTPNSQSEPISRLEKLKMLRRKSSLGVPNSAADSPVTADSDASSNRSTDPSVNATSKVADENKLKSTKNETETSNKAESKSHSVENCPLSTATNTPNSQSEPLNRLDKLKMLRRKSSLGVPNSTAGYPVTADSDASSNRSTDPPANATSKVAAENRLKSPKNETKTETFNNSEMSENNQLKKLKMYSALRKSSLSSQTAPGCSTPLNGQVSSSPYLPMQASSISTQGSLLDGISPITGSNSGIVSPRKSESDSSSIKDDTGVMDVGFMNSTQPKDATNLAESSQIEKTNSINENSPKAATLTSASKLQALKSLYKKRNSNPPKSDPIMEVEGEEQQINANPSIDPLPRSESEATNPNFEEGFIEGFSDTGDDVLESVLNPKRIASNDSAFSSPDSSRKSSISNDSYTEVQPADYIDFSDKSLWEKQKIPALCIGEAIPSPWLSTGEASFPPALLKSLELLKFCGPSCIQSVAWPAVERRRCLAAVAPPHSGKTVAYLLPIVADFMSPVTHSDLPKSHGPIAIIICSSWKKVQAVYDLFQTFLSGTKCKILSFFVDGHSKRKKASDLLRGCDILITVPSCLLEFYTDNVLCVKRCCHFILDDGSTLLSHNIKELKEVMRHFARSIELRSSVPISLQVLLCAERWTKRVASFVNKFMNTPLLLFTSFLEAAVYAKVPMHARVCKEKNKKSNLLEILEKSKKTVICTNSSSKAFEIHNFLKCENVRSFLVSDEMEHYISDGVIQDWKSVKSTATPHCLVVTDTAFTHMSISSANILIHYDIPEISRLQFGNRFSCIAEHFTHSIGTPDCACHILVSDDCSLQAPSLLKLIQRSGVAVCPELKDLAIKEATVKRNSNAPLCHYMKAFGTCTLINCQQRHYIDPVNDQPNTFPCEGDISALVTHICHATHLYVRILKYLSPELISLSGNYAKIGFQLRKFFSVESNRTKVEDPDVGKTYILKEENGLFYRVTVLAIIPASRAQRQKIKLLFRDEGWVKTYDNSQLFEYIQVNQFPPPLVVEVYLCGVGTPDTSLDWNPQANRFMSQHIKGKEIHGKIVLCLGETLWLHPVVLREKLMYKNDYINVLSLDKSLKDAGHGIANKNHLPSLIEACGKDIPLPKEIKRTVEDSKTNDEAPQYSYAFLELDVSEDVFVSSVVSPHEFYVQREKFVKCLDQLLDKIEDKIRTKELEKCKAFLNGMHCLAPFKEDNSYYRAVITEVLPDSDDVQVFFADFGDFGRVSTDFLFALPPEFSLLPFQAIRCELYGINAPHGGWTDKAGDTLYNLTRNEDGDMIILQIWAHEKSQKFGNGNHYIVELWNSDKSISDQLLHEGLVIPTEESTPANTLEVEAVWNEKDMDEDDKLIHAKFLATVNRMMYGLPTGLPNEDETADKVENVVESAKPKEMPKKRVKKSIEVVEIKPKVNNSPYQYLQRLVRCIKKEPKRAKPFIKWWDTMQHVNILIHVMGIEIYELDVQDEKFTFSTFLQGMDYYTEEEFFSSVHSKDAVIKTTVEGLSITLRKQDHNNKQWPQLTKQRFTHIKYDWNHINDSDSEEMITDGAPLNEIENPSESMVAHYDSDDKESSGDDEEYIQPWKKLAQYKDPFNPLD